MKTFVILSFLLSQLSLSLAQAPDTAKKIENIDTLAKHGALFVMDGMVLQKPYHLNPDSIIDITVITRDKAKEWFESDPQSDVVILISRRRAIVDYLKKFSAFSETYKKYITTEHGDHGIMYIIINANGEIKLAGNKDDQTRELYEIPEDKIKSVGFSQQETCCGVNRFCVIEVPQ